MASAVQAASPPARSRSEKVVNFVPAAVAAPFFLRCGALFADYMVLIVVPVMGLMLHKFFGDGSTYAGPGLGTWLLIIVLWMFNFLLLPMWRGQTIGKTLTGLTIVNRDGTSVGPGGILRRDLLGYAVTAATLGIGFLMSIFSSEGRALHDVIAGTVVVRGRKIQL